MVPLQVRPARSRIRASRLWLVLLAALAGLFLLGSCFTFGDESSWIRVQNLGSSPANFSVQYFNIEGDLVGERACPSQDCPSLAPGAALTIPLEGVSQFPDGVLGSIIVSSDQPLGALLVSDVGRDEGRFQSAGDTFSTVPAFGALLLPLLMREAGAEENWNSRLIVQNVSATIVACASLRYSGADGEPVQWDPYDPSAPSPQRLSGCPNGGFPIQPGASAARRPGAPSGFMGAAEVRLHRNAQGNGITEQQVVASAGIWNDDTMHFGSYRAITAAELGTTVLLPLVERTASGFWSTEFQIQNADPSAPASVTVRYENTQAGISKQNTITVRGSKLCKQNDTNNDCLAVGDDLPAGFRGHAVLTSNRPIAVVVNRSMWANASFDSYRGVALQQAGTKVYLPLVVKSEVSPDRTGEAASIRILVADGGSAEVTIRFRATGSSTSEATMTVPVAGTKTVALNTNPSVPLPGFWSGSAILESDRPIVAIVEVTTGSFTGDTLVIYNGIPAS